QVRESCRLQRQVRGKEDPKGRTFKVRLNEYWLSLLKLQTDLLLIEWAVAEEAVKVSSLSKIKK
ncbi:MAG: hypothetical protein KGH53_04045, partial [Candidatus Micrarchaeota archaeon]|nr:hypothetical protein [Candidatus Micrarchaeota archaeon]